MTHLTPVLMVLGFLTMALRQLRRNREIAVRLIYSKSGKPMLSDDVEIWVHKDREHSIRISTGSDGVAKANLLDGVGQVSVYAQHDGWYLDRCDFPKHMSPLADTPFYDSVAIRMREQSKVGVGLLMLPGSRTAVRVFVPRRRFPFVLC